MTDLIIELLKEINIAQLASILVMFCFFYSRLDRKIEKLDEKLSSKVEELGSKIEDVDRRLCRIEGSLSVHGHCLFNQAQPVKKAD